MMTTKTTLKSACYLPYPTRQTPFHLTIFVLILSLFTCDAKADLDETYLISLGRSIAFYDTELLINSQDQSINKEIDLENDLGLDSNVRAGWLRISYRLVDRHRIRLTYTPIRRSSEKVSERDISIEGNTIKSGASLSSSLKSEIFDIDYVYSFYKRPHLELGISGGLYWYATEADVNASGQIVLNDGGASNVVTDYEAKQKIHAPLPLFGINGTYELSSRWYIHGGARYLYVSINDITGRITELKLAGDYYFAKNWGIGLSLSRFGLNVEKDGIVLRNSAKFFVDGMQAYIVFKY